MSNLCMMNKTQKTNDIKTWQKALGEDTLQVTTTQVDQLARIRAKLQREMAVESEERAKRDAEREKSKARAAYKASPEGQRESQRRMKQMCDDIRKVIYPMRDIYSVPAIPADVKYRGGDK